MTEKQLDPERGREVAEGLRKLGVSGILHEAAQIGRIPSLACQMDHCLCPEELGGRGFFEEVPDELPDWMPTTDHIELKSKGGKLTVNNVALAHRLCNRTRFSIETSGQPGPKDRARVEAARDARPRMERAALLRSLQKLWNQEGGSLGELMQRLIGSNSLSPVPDKELSQRIREALA